jgi:hypothetical protein
MGDIEKGLDHRQNKKMAQLGRWHGYMHPVRSQFSHSLSADNMPAKHAKQPRLCTTPLMAHLMDRDDAGGATLGSNKKLLWRCVRCNQSYEERINNRAKSIGYCSPSCRQSETHAGVYIHAMPFMRDFVRVPFIPLYSQLTTPTHPFYFYSQKTVPCYRGPGSH